MVEVQQQAFAAIEESEAEEIVVEEREHRTENDVDEAEADFAFSHDHLRAERGVAVHVVDVVGESWVGVMDDGSMSDFGSVAVHFNCLVYRSILESAVTTTKKAQLPIGPKAALLNPSAEEIVFPGKPITAESEWNVLGLFRQIRVDG